MTIATLENAGYVAVDKTHEGRASVTYLSLKVNYTYDYKVSSM
jgi:hypothetical protein